MKRAPIIVAILGLVVVAVLSSVFIVDQRQQALVLAFGRVERVETEPGLEFKFPPPFNTVEYFEKRILFV